MDNEEQKSILAIDDNVTQLKIFENFLRPHYELSLVKSAAEALGLLKTRLFDLILLDIEMPDISGFEFLHEIRKIPQCMSSPVIIITGHSDPELLNHARSRSASAVLTKPIDPEQLFKTIETAMSIPVENPFNL